MFGSFYHELVERFLWVDNEVLSVYFSVYQGKTFMIQLLKNYPNNPTAVNRRNSKGSIGMQNIAISYRL